MLNFQEIPMVDGPLNRCQETILTSLMAVPICILIALKKEREREMSADAKLALVLGRGNIFFSFNLHLCNSEIDRIDT